MDKASAYGAGDCRFESYRGHCLMSIHARESLRLEPNYVFCAGIYDEALRPREASQAASRPRGLASLEPDDATKALGPTPF